MHGEGLVDPSLDRCISITPDDIKNKLKETWYNPEKIHAGIRQWGHYVGELDESDVQFWLKIKWSKQILEVISLSTDWLLVYIYSYFIPLKFRIYFLLLNKSSDFSYIKYLKSYFYNFLIHLRCYCLKLVNLNLNFNTSNQTNDIKMICCWILGKPTKVSCK